MQAVLGPRGLWQGDSRWHRCCAGSPDRRQPLHRLRYGRGGRPEPPAGDQACPTRPPASPTWPSSTTTRPAGSMWPTPSTRSRRSDQEIHAGVGLGTTRADGSCSAPFFISLGWHVPADEVCGRVCRGGPLDRLRRRRDGQELQLRRAKRRGSPRRCSSGLEPSKPGTSRPPTTALVGKHYNCATAGMWVMDNSTPGDAGPGEDFLESDAFALTPDATASVNTPPASTTDPASGGDRPAAQHVEAAPSRVLPDSRAPRLAEQ